MADFDISAFTRGISGGITGALEGKREAKDRAREQQRQVMADLLSRRRVSETEAAGRATRKRNEEAAARRIADAERESEEKRLKQEQDARQIDLLMSQLPEDQRFPIVGLSTTATVREINRRLGIANRVPRSTTEPKPFGQDARVRRVVMEFNRLSSAGLNPKDDTASMLARLESGGDLTPPPVDSARVRQQAMLEAVQMHRHEFSEEELPELTSILEGIVNEKEPDKPSIDDIKQMIRDLSAQGLTPEEIQANLAQRGINVRL